MSGRCCPGQDDGNGILRAANSGVAVTGITQRFSPAPFTSATAETPLQITCPRRSPGPAAVTARTPRNGLELLRRVRVRVATVTGPRTGIDTGLIADSVRRVDGFSWLYMRGQIALFGASERSRRAPGRPLPRPRVCGTGRWTHAAGCGVQQTRAAWKDSLAGFPPENRSWRTWMPTVWRAAPGMISTVAGSNGTAVPAEPRVATAAHPDSGRLVMSVYWPGAGLKDQVWRDPREMRPFAATTATLTSAAAGQITARWNGMPALSPPPGFLVST